MHRSEATLGELLALLPDLDELEVLQLRLMSEAFRDPGKEWASSSRFATVDKRIVTPEAAEHALEEAENALRQFIAAIYAGLRPVLRAFFEGDHSALARHLVELGEGLEQEGRLQGARRCYRSALTAALPLAEKSSQILALRRVGRVSLTLGDFQEAVSYYERSAELARDAGDVLGQVIARTGLGNVRMWQGRWNEAEPPYFAALELMDAAPAGEMVLERGQLYNNLANLTTRQGKVDQSEEWFQRAFGVWESVSSPRDLAVCHFNHAHLRETQERWDEARESYEAALALPTPSSFRAMFATDFAELWVHEGHLTSAEEWALVAEEHAIAAHSPYVLGHLYRGRGNIALARGDVDGFNFFEKALEIAREKEYLFLEAETLVDYAALRAQNGGVDEAVDFLKHACEIFRGLGALGELERAEKALAELSGRSEEEPPRAAAD